jgi:CshA-type fibril repeat protein
VTVTSATPSICTVSGSTLTLVSPGTCTLDADQGGDVTHAAATTVTRSFQVTAAVPPPTTSPLTSNGPAGATQTVAAPLPPGGAITLLDGIGNPVTVVVLPGQGSVLLDVSTGIISFVPQSGFAGTTSPVGYRVTDQFGRTSDSVYSATVASASPVPTSPTAAAPQPAAHGASTGTVRFPASSVRTPAALPVTTVRLPRAVVGVRCALTAGAVTSGCTVDLLAWISGRWVVVGSGSRDGLAGPSIDVPVRLTAAGRALAARPGGFRARVGAEVSEAGSADLRPASTLVRVVAQQVLVPRPVFFDTASARVHAADARYLQRLRHQLAGVRVVTCIGYTDARGGSAYNRALGHRRSVAVCRRLTHGLDVRVRWVTRGEERPFAANLNPRGRALNRRTEIVLGY